MGSAPDTRSTSPPPAPSPPAAPAFYSGGAYMAPSPAFLSPSLASSPSPSLPYVWSGQPMMMPYGTPFYPPIYFQGGSCARPPLSVSTVMSYPTAESEGRLNSKMPTAKVLSTSKTNSGYEVSSHSESQGSGEGSAESREEGCEVEGPSSARKISSSEKLTDVSQHNTADPSSSTTAESCDGRGPSVCKLPVSAPGRVMLPASSHNIAVDPRKAHANGSTKNGPNGVRIAHAIAPSTMADKKGVVSDQQWIQDERELKRQKRKQSNRDSARRSRLRKQQECEELARRVAELDTQNNALRSELDQMRKVCNELEMENSSIVDELRNGLMHCMFQNMTDPSRSFSTAGSEGKNHASHL